MSHSVNGPSSFSRRRSCSASMQMELDIKDSESVYAAEGSAAHALGEECLKTGKNPADFVDKKFGEFTFPDGKVEEFFVDGDMIEAVQVYVDHCRPLINENTMIEQKLDLPFLGPDEHSKTGYVRGTADFISLVGNVLHVVDYKHGKGVVVDVVENIQGLSYAMGAANLFEDKKWDTLRITIVQPRAFGKSIKAWDASRDDILDYKMDFSEAALKTFMKDVEVTPSIDCRFCKALPFCKGIINLIKEITGMDILKDGSNPMDINKLSEDQIVDVIFNKLPIIKGWFNKLEDYAQQRAEERNPLPGTKLVQTKERRVWRDVEVAEQHFAAALGEKAYDKKFKTAPQIEKTLGKKEFGKIEDTFVHKVSSGVTLAPVDDPRDDVRPTGSSEFGAVTGDLF